MILYDCYDKDKKNIGIIFAENCTDLLIKNPNVKYVLGLDYFTRQRVWHEVRKNGLFPTKF